MENLVLVPLELNHVDHLPIEPLWQENVHQLEPADLRRLLGVLIRPLDIVDEGGLHERSQLRVVVSIVKELFDLELCCLFVEVSPLLLGPHRPLP